MAAAGALQTDLIVFERAVCIRHMSLAAVQQAIVDDRTATANRMIQRTNAKNRGHIL